MLSISQPHAHITACLIVEETKYEVESFNIDFMQPSDHKGQPQQEVKGGQLRITIPQIADDILYGWAKRPTMLKDGRVVFQTDLGATVLSVDFTRAYCVTLNRDINITSGTSTFLTIAPETVSLDGMTHDNRWSK